jgi:hypothetical protein
MATPASASTSTCARCHHSKPADQFYVRRTGRRAGFLTEWCKQCSADTQRQNYERRKAGFGSQESLFATKVCRACGRELSMSEFTRNHNRKDGRHTICKECSNQAFKAARKNDYYVLRHYGLTITEYDALLSAQSGKCAICGMPETKKYGRTGGDYRLAVDHDHDTGKVRALLCHACNAGIGQFSHDPELMAVAIRYLLDHMAKPDS